MEELTICPSFQAFKEQVDLFRVWASLPGRAGRYGEWECDYEPWGDIYEAFWAFIKDCPPSQWTSEIKRILLYALARDNEGGILADDLFEDMERVHALIELCFQEGEWDAREQIASRLGTIPFSEQHELWLLRFADDEYEYVRRMALSSLGRIDSAHAESVAEKAWFREEEWQEYQRLQALDTLHRIRSGKLRDYLQFAKEDGRKYLVALATEIEGNIAHSN